MPSRSLSLARLGSQRVVVAAAAVTIVLATVLLTALWVYVDAAATAGVRAAMVAAPQADSGVSVRTSTDDPQQLDALDARVSAALDRAIGAVPYELSVRFETTDSYTLTAAAPPPPDAADPAEPPDQAAEAAVDELTYFAVHPDITAHADLVAGDWPAPTAAGQPVAVALHRDAADALGVAPGDVLTVVQRRDDLPVEVAITGTFLPRDPAGWYWRSDPQDTTGFVQGATFPVRGPLLVADRGVLTDAVGSSGTAAEWHLGPDWARATPDAVAPTRTALLALRRDLPAEDEAPFSGTVVIETELDDLLSSVQRALVSNRSMMIVPLLQLALLAAYTLLLAARLLSEHRRSEVALLRARGMSGRQVAGLAVQETALLVVPVVAVAPLLAALTLRLVDGRGPFGALGGTADRPEWTWWLVSAAAGLLCALALVLPSLGREETYVATQSERGRTGRRGTLQRAGADVVLLAGAVLAYVQLRHYESPVVGTGPAPQIDPLLVLGPCLALLAAAAVSVRLLTLVARIAQVAAARGSSLLALGAWQVARRPLRYSGPALLLVLALAIGAMSSAYSASWRQSQADQAEFAAGADVRVAVATDAKAVPALGQPGAVAALPEVDAVAAAWRSPVAIGDVSVDLLALDAEAAGGVLRLRSDLASGSAADLMAPLAADRSCLDGIELPSGAAEVSVTFTAGSEPVAPVSEDVTLPPGSLSLAIADATGSTVRLDPLAVVFDGSEQSLTFDLRAAAAGSEPGATPTEAPAGPLRIVGARVRMPTVFVIGGLELGPDAQPVPYRSTFAINAFTADGAAVATAGRPAWEVASPESSNAPAGPVADPGFGVLAAEVTAELGAAFTQVVDVFVGAAVTELPALLDRTAATAAGVGVGDHVVLRTGATSTSVTVADIVEAFPGTDPSTGVMVVDYETLVASRWLGGGATTGPTEWWLASADPEVTAGAAADAPGLAAGVVSIDRLTATYREDPLGAMTLGALLAGFAAALAFAAVGFAVNLVIGARERLAEFAVLRALGVSQRQVLVTLLVEQAFLVGLGVSVGLAIGLLVSALVVPLVVISPRTLEIFPPVLLDVPWEVLALTAGGTVLGLGVLVAVAAGRLQRSGLGSTLRLGDGT